MDKKELDNEIPRATNYDDYCSKTPPEIYEELKKYPCILNFTSPIPAECYSDGCTQFRFCCYEANKEFRVYLTPWNDTTWELLIQVLRIALPMCARCTLHAPATDNEGNDQ